MSIEFKNKVLMIGYGAVAKSTLPILLKHVKIPYNHITIIDFADQRRTLKRWAEEGVRYVQEKITPHNITKVLSQHVSAGGLIIDLAWNIDCLDILKWSRNNGVLYVNASVEEWDPYSDIHMKTSLEKSLYYRYTKLREMVSQSNGSPTAVVDHGANPGLVTHFTKKGIIDIAEKVIRDKKVSRKDAKIIEHFIREERFGHLAMKLGIKVIHSSERDAQTTNRPKESDEFVGTWGIEGMRGECVSPVEIGWGTHEKELPDLAIMPPYGTKNQIILPQMGLNTWVRSWIPHQEIVGMIVTHGEAFGISEMLTVRQGNRVLYRPTVHYAYMPCNETLSSLHELRCRNYELQSHLRTMSDEIVGGVDTFGVLIMGHPYNSWWTGSVLSIEESRRLVRHQNATTVQVAIGVVSAIMWTIRNPNEGLCFPEDLPHDYILSIAKPYLGKFVSEPSDWTPLVNYQVFFKENPHAQPNKTDLWQFNNFLFKP